ncbi:MAG: hypothetical protein JSW27_02150 [Phycisphaerales bacterium]|nr:MAG: hypothetical protein JSW27_02150 [Phycisphaerales bacterium]
MPTTTLQRTTFTTSREMDFVNEKELTAQTGHAPDDWPIVIGKELVDNALDACEEAGMPPEINVKVTPHSITVSDNGPGIGADTVTRLLDFSVRVSSREAYVAPDRGKQGNALKTVIMMPFVLDGNAGHVEIAAHGVRHIIDIGVDAIRQRPVVRCREEESSVRIGTAVKVSWPDSACSILDEARARFLQVVAADYTFMNPHLTLSVNWMGEQTSVMAVDPAWRKWRPSDPTSCHWYRPEDMKRLVGAYVADDQDHGRDRTVREFIAEFRGLTGTAKQRMVLEATGLARTNLSALVNGNGLHNGKVEALLAAMREQTKPVKPNHLGVIGRDNLMARFASVGCTMHSFEYRKVAAEDETGLPFVLETAFGWLGDEAPPQRRMVLGVNWSPGIVNPFRQLGSLGVSLDSILEQQRVGQDEPVTFLMHCAAPRVEYTDRGKSAVVVHGGTDQ